MRFLVLLLLCSCGTLRFEYKGDKKNSFLPVRGHTKFAEFEEKRVFSGGSTRDQVVDVSRYVKVSGFSSIANLELENIKLGEI